MSVTLAQASTIVDVALAKGRETNCAPLTVAVLDAGGHLVAFKREDRSGILRYDIAYGKAWGALGMGFGSRELAERAAKNPVFIGALTTIAQGRLVPGPGGVLIKDAGGAVLIIVPSPLSGEGCEKLSTYTDGRGVPLSHSSLLKLRSSPLPQGERAR